MLLATGLQERSLREQSQVEKIWSILKISEAIMFLNLALYGFDTHSGLRIHSRLRRVWLTLDYIDLFGATRHNVLWH